jgi:hypothetical protein
MHSLPAFIALFNKDLPWDKHPAIAPRIGTLRLHGSTTEGKKVARSSRFSRPCRVNAAFRSLRLTFARTGLSTLLFVPQASTFFQWFFRQTLPTFNHGREKLD